MQLMTCVKFTDKDLDPGQTVHYRVSIVNNAPSGQHISNTSSSVSATTQPASETDAPGGLVVKSIDQTSISLVWNAQSDDTDAAPTTGYRIDVSEDEGATWAIHEADTGSTHTSYTHSGLAPETTRHYRVYAISVVGTSPGFTGFDDGIDRTNDSDAMATTDDATVPGAPTVTLGTVTDTEINLSWTRPASDGGAAITGWIVEKAYGGSFLDVERTNADAFTDAETWWDGLGCPEMVMAVMDSGTADMDNPFCAMYADLGDTEEAEVERVFAVRYFVIDDAATNSYRHYNLLPETERMYRLAAVNGAGIGMWSNTITATTLALDTTLGDVMGLTVGPTADSDPGSVKLSWTAGANANIHWVAVVRVADNGDFDVDNSVWTQASAQDSHVVAMETEGLIPGSYRAMVIAGMHDSTAGTTQWSIWQSTPFTYPQ